MRGRLYRFLAEDHRRLESLLTGIVGLVDIAGDRRYAQFRQGLLRHIAMEEKVLLPFARKKNGGDPLPVTGRIHLDHGAIAALLAPTPTPQMIATLRTILDAHNPVEEGPGGLYETCETLAGTEMNALLERLRAVPEVKLAPLSDSPRALESMKQAVERAGYRLGPL
jgi:Hemerythrin HHE cation binding domain